MFLRTASIAKHIAKKVPANIMRKLRRVPPIDVLVSDWAERLGKVGAKRKILYLAIKYDYGDENRGLSYEEYNFLGSIKELDAEIIRLDIYTLHRLYGKEAVTKAVKEAVLIHNIDTLIYFRYTDILDHQLLKELRDGYKLHTIIWLSDDDVRYEQTKELVRCFSLVVTTILERHKQRQKLGINSYHAQFYSNTTLYRNLHIKKAYDVVFIGQKFGSRGASVDFLRRNGIDVRTFGPFWGAGSRLSQMEMIDVINKAKIMLNFSGSSKDPSKRYIKGRVFEIIACGAFMLTEECNDLDLYLQRGKEVVTFEGKEDMLAKIRHYLAHEQEREAIAAAGERKIRREYTYRGAFKKILGV